MHTLKHKIPSDSLMWDMWTSIYHLAALTAADQLGIFACLKDHECDDEHIAETLQISERPVFVLVNLLVNLGFLKKNSDKISLTPIAQTYLLPESPLYWGSVLHTFRDRTEHKKIMNAIQQGDNQLTFNNKTFTDMWQEGSITPEAARAFTDKMHTTILPSALEAINSNLFESTQKLLDIGGGSGCFSIAFTQKYPDRKAVVFELPAVCEITKEYISDFNAGEKVSIHSGNFFIENDWPPDCDGMLFSQILHDWPLETCKQLLTSAYKALPSGGKIYINEMMLDKNKSSPLATVCFDLLMHVNHKSQQFSEKDLHDLLKTCGFSNLKTIYTQGYFSITVGTK